MLNVPSIDADSTPEQCRMRTISSAWAGFSIDVGQIINGKISTGKDRKILNDTRETYQRKKIYFCETLGNYSR